jgi:hypothetical protein
MNALKRGLVFLGLCIVISNAPAATLRPLPIEELSQKADLILNGVVTGKVSLLDAKGGIYTKIELAVTDVWKGNLKSNSFVIVQAGGTVGDTRVEVSGQVQYEVGEEVVAFLVLSPRGEGVTIGLSQGKFHVSKDSTTNEKVVHNPFHGSSEATNHTAASFQGLGPKANRDRLSLTELKHRATTPAP